MKLVMRSSPSRRLFVGAATLGLAAAACSGGSGDGPTAPITPSPPTTATAGALRIMVTSAFTDIGAVSLQIAGGQIDSLTTTMSSYSQSATVANRQLVLVGSGLSGEVARIWVPDVNKVSLYTAAVIEAAARSTYQLKVPGTVSSSVAR